MFFITLGTDIVLGNFLQFGCSTQKINDTIEAKDSGTSILLVNQSTDEILIINYGGRKYGFYKVIPSKTMDGSRISPQIEKVSFENYAQFKPIDNERHAIIPCPLTPTKYLILITNINWQRTRYQGVFSKSTWLLVDLNEKRVKVVYPRVYDIANLTKQSKGSKPFSNSPRTIPSNILNISISIGSNFLEASLKSHYNSVK